MIKNLNICLLVFGVVIGIAIVFQFNTKISYTSNFPADEYEARRELIKIFLDEQSYFQSRIVLLREQIDEAQQNINDQSEVSNLAILDSLKKSIGLTEISGPGLDIILDDSPFANREINEINPKDLIQASDLRDVINALFSAHSQAVSINNQRVVATSSIKSVGSNILVNNSHIAPPFAIKAVGDPEILLRSITNQGLLFDLYSRIGQSKIQFKVTVNNFVKIPIYNGHLRTEYLNLVEK